jgi:HK97 family phage portal protein
MGASFFGNGTHMGGVLSHPGSLGEKAQSNLRKSIEAVHQGASRAMKMLILEEGMKYERMGIPPEDAQFLQTRQHQVEDVCRWFRVPPHKIQHLLRSTFSNIEHQSIEFVTDTIRPWLVRMEQEANRKLLRPSEQGVYYTENLVDALLRGDALARSQALEIQARNGVLTPDEWRRIENRNPLPDGLGSRPMVTVNTVPLSRVDEQPEADEASEIIRKHLAALVETRGPEFAAGEAKRIANLIKKDLQ